MTCRMFRCWRLYSWMRFTCTSKMAAGSTLTPVRSSMSCASCRLVGVLDLRATRRRSPHRRPAARACAAAYRSRIHSSPMRWRDAAAPAADSTAPPSGAASRRWSCCRISAGHSSAKSFSTSLLEQLGMQRRHAVDRMRARARQIAPCACSARPDSSMSDEPRGCAPRRRRSATRTSSRKRALISNMISRCRGSTRWNIGNGQRSSASGSSVWLVYAKVCRVMLHARSQVQALLVQQQAHQLRDGHRRMRVVELDRELLVERLQAGSSAPCRMRSMSWREQDTKKYCCSRRSSLPFTCSSFG